MMRRRDVLLVLILLIAVTAWPAAQRGTGTGTGGGRGRGAGPGGGTPTPQQRPVFKATVELVQVDVVVRDRDGNPVRGLTAEDFVILDRSKPQSVATFKEIRRDQDRAAPDPARVFPSTLKLDVASNQSAKSERLVVMLLDDLHAYRGRDAVVKGIARQVVESLGPQSTMALVMTSGRNSVDVTEDRSRLLEAIEKFKGERAVRRPMTAPDNRGRAAAMDALQMFDANMQLYNSMRNAARVLAGNDGRRKAFVLISENIAKDLTGVFELRAPRGDPPIDASAYFTSGDPEALAAVPTPITPYHDIAILEMMDAMRRGNVATYSIDPRGHVSSQDLLRECSPGFGGDEDVCLGGSLPDWNSWVRQAQHGLEIMSAASGGIAVVNTNDFVGGINRIMTDLDNYYLLGFYPDDLNKKGYRKLDVQVKGRPELTLRYRRGYELGREVVENKKVEPIFALSSNALPATDLPLRVYAVAMPGSGATARVPIALEVTVPRKDVQQPDASVQDDITFGVLVVDMNGAKVKQQVGRGGKLVLRPRDPSLPPPDTVTYQVGLAIDLNPGRYQLRASAMSTKVGQGGSVFLPFDVPDYAKSRLALSGLVVGYAGGARIPVFASDAPARRGMPPGRAGSPPQTSRGFAQTAPGGLPFPPSLDREFRVGDEVALYFEVLRRDLARQVDTAIAIVDAADRIVRRYSQTMPASSNGKISFRLPLSEVGAGAFRLRVTVASGSDTAMSEIGIVVK
jgi:VWFA-related protein